MRFTEYSFGSVRVDGVTYDHDLIIDRGKIRKRKKAASRRFRGADVPYFQVGMKVGSQNSGS